MRERIAASRALHGALARAIAGVFTRHGVGLRAPTAAFYLYPSFEAHRERLASAHSVTTGPGLAAALLDRHAVATLPGSAFGEGEDVLSLRVATSGLYGDTDEQRLRALTDPDPAALPWIAEPLGALDGALSQLLAPKPSHRRDHHRADRSVV